MGIENREMKFFLILFAFCEFTQSAALANGLDLLNGYPMKQKRVDINADIFPYAPAGDTMPEIYYGKRSVDFSSDQEFQKMRNEFKNMIGKLDVKW